MTDHDPTLPPPPPGDRRSAKAEAKADKARAKAMRPIYRKPWFIALAVVAVIVVISVASGGGDDDTDTATVAPAADRGADSTAGDDAAAGDDAEAEAGGEDPRTLSGNQDAPPAADVTLSDCTPDDSFGGTTLAAQVTILNNSAKASDYSIEVVFESPDGAQQFDTSYAMVSGLNPGQTSVQDVGGYAKAPGEYVCRIAEVNRWAAAGA